jgi:predicted MFS family arabinose efflux permease
LPALKDHLRVLKRGRIKREFWDLKSILKRKTTLDSIWLIVSLMFAAFTIIPFVSAYLVANVGLQQSDIALVFLCGGLATFVSAHVIGVISDRFGKLRVFNWLAILSIFPIVLLTHLRHVSLLTAIVVTTLFTVSISARGIPALAMITASIDRAKRGRFLSLTSSVQQASSAAASLFAGSLLGMSSDGRILNFSVAGYVAVAATLSATVFARRLRPASLT